MKIIRSMVSVLSCVVLSVGFLALSSCKCKKDQAKHSKKEQHQKRDKKMKKDRKHKDGDMMKKNHHKEDRAAK